MNLIKVILAGILVMGIATFLSDRFSSPDPQQVSGSIYDFKINSLEGKEINFEKYKGKKLLIVNTASKCGYTYQYAGLESLQQQYGAKVTVLGFPANNFLWQEPGTNEEIATFCEKNYGVTFQMFEKISVKGKDQHPLYQWLNAKSGKTPSWNFCKYVIDEQGNFLAFFDKKVEPLDKSILGLLAP